MKRARQRSHRLARKRRRIVLTGNAWLGSVQLENHSVQLGRAVMRVADPGMCPGVHSRRWMPIAIWSVPTGTLTWTTQDTPVFAHWIDVVSIGPAIITGRAIGYPVL